MIQPAPQRSTVRIPLLLLGVQILLVVLGISRYDATSFVFRGTDVIDFFNFFWRFRIAGVLSVFDLLMAALLGLTLARSWVAGRLRPSAFDRVLYTLIALSVVSIASKLFYQTPENTAQDFLFKLRDVIYFGGFYFVVSRLSWSERRYQAMMKLIIGLAALTVVLSYAELLYLPIESRVTKYGRPVEMRDIDDYLFMLFAQFWLIALALEQFPRILWQRLLLIGGVFYTFYSVFTGVGKGVLITYPLYIAYLAWYHRLYRRRWFQIVAAALLGVFAFIGFSAARDAANIQSGSALYVYSTFSSEDASILTRVVEAANFGLNLYDRNALVQGIGMGSKWYEYLPQPPDPGAWPKEEAGSSWHLGMHIPLARLGLDFGAVGMVVLLWMFLACFRRTVKALRSDFLQPVTNAFLLSAWLVIGTQLIIGSLSGPKANLLTGALFGAASGLLDAFRRGSVIALEQPQHNSASS